MGYTNDEKALKILVEEVKTICLFITKALKNKHFLTFDSTSLTIGMMPMTQASTSFTSLNIE